MGNYRSSMRLFGFCGLFGFSCSGFSETSCSVCSVDFVEKMWRSLWGSRWEKMGKSCVKVEHGRILGGFGGINEFFTGLVEKFYGWIYTWFYLCEDGGFTQFPHSLLLQLLNI